MPRIIKNTLLNYIPINFEIEKNINHARIFAVNNNPIKNGNVIYLCEREIRAKDNFALQFALQKCKELNLPLKIIHPKINYEYQQKRKFIDSQIKQVQKIFQTFNFDFEIIDKKPSEIIKNLTPAILIIDFNPILKRNYLKNVSCKSKSRSRSLLAPLNAGQSAARCLIDHSKLSLTFLIARVFRTFMK